MTKNFLAITLLMLATTACNQVNFKLGASSDDDPVDILRPTEPIPFEQVDPDRPTEPVDPDKPIVLPEPISSKGSCTKGDSVLGCLPCEYELPPVIPEPLTKAQQLAKIMELTCPIANKSDPANKVTPSYAQTIARVAACTAAIYPVTDTSNSQDGTLAGLLGSDPSLRNKMFSGRYFQPPHSDNFERHFGLEQVQARKIFCYQEKPSTQLKGKLLTFEYYHYCPGQAGPGCDQWKNDAQAQARFNEAQTIRDQLRRCIDQPPPPPVQKPPVILPHCQWEKWEGDYSKGAPQEIARLMGLGYKIAMETSNSCVDLKHVPMAEDYAGTVKIAGYNCK